MVVIVTGASSGIGKAVCQKFIKKGHKVYGLGLQELELDGLKYYQADILDRKRIKEIIEEIYNIDERIDVLINSAGMGISGAVEDTKLKDAKYMFDVNFFGTFDISKSVIPYMRNNKFGRIANISSVASILPIPFQTFYSANKAAINLYSEGLNIELRPFNIKVINFLPGDIATGFTDNRRKNKNDSAVYGHRINKSVELMEKDERKGMKVEYVAKVFYKNIVKKRPPIRKIVGIKYKIFVFLSRLLPQRLINYIMYQIYGK